MDTCNIHGHGSDYLHVVFSDSDFCTTPVDVPRCYACISTVDRLQLPTRSEGIANNLRVEDSFTNGDFYVEILLPLKKDHTQNRTSKFTSIVTTRT
jgi:hypothetical protein